MCMCINRSIIEKTTPLFLIFSVFCMGGGLERRSGFGLGLGFGLVGRGRRGC